MGGPRLAFHGLRLKRETFNEHRRTVPLNPPEPTLCLSLPSGQVREVALSEDQLIKLIGQAAEALQRLRNV